MSEPQKISIEGKDYFGWHYEEQTKIKHRVLGAYSRIWISKLGKYNNTMFFDCHAGCGAYVDSETGEVSYGSSFLVEKIGAEINAKRKFNNFICACETKQSYHDNFQKVMADIGQKFISLKKDDFQNVLSAPLVKRYYSTHPTLFFVDPFGYTMKMSSIAKMMVNRKNEVIVNFMFDFINRFLFVSDPNLLDEFFGSSDWRNANGLSLAEREKYLVDLFKQNLKKATNAKYVYAYRLCYADKDQTYYYLVHATNNIEGITHMKESFASVNNGRVEYLGKYQDSISLFDLADFKSSDFIARALKPFASQRHSFEYIWGKVADSVPYTSKDLSVALAALETEGKIKIVRMSSKRGQYKQHDMIIFGDNL